jgi:predicted HAD superfamily phosphohydrolase YqeG
MERPKIACIDFDATISEYGTVNLLPESIKSINELIDSGWKVIIFTSRKSKRKIKKTLQDNNICAKIYTRKPDARVYIDDRAIEFNGSWSGIVNKVKNFKPWYIK